MRLLVSVATPEEAAAALAGGADIVDAKDPRRGALGVVSLPQFVAIHTVVARRCPVSAAIGDASNEAAVARDAAAYARAGASFVKVGFAGIQSGSRIAALLDAALRATPDVVPVAYADDGIAPATLIEIAAAAGARGILIDTTDKTGPGLCAVATSSEIARWIELAHRHAMCAAVAGKVTGPDVDALLDTGADIVGVRGAACEGGRTGTISEVNVRALRAHVSRSAAVI